MIHNMVGGGGQSDGPVEAGTIVVTYPAGATCTVTNGGDTYTALDISGAAAFIVEPGTWTVNAVQGSDNDSKSVTVTAGGWVEVELSFWSNELYTPGNQWTSVTGGWRVVPVKTREATAGYATEYALEETSTELGVRWTAYGSTQTTKGIALMPEEKIPLAGFDSIKVTLGTFDFTTSYTNGILFIIDKEVTDGMNVYTESIAKTTFKNSELGAGKEFTIDISSYPGEYYVGVGISSADNTANNYFSISSMIMEVGT